MNKDKICVVLKNGFHFTIVCDEVTVKRNTLTGDIVGFSYTGAVENIPIYLRLDDVSAIIQEKERRNRNE